MEQTPPPIQPTTVRCVRCGYDLSGATIGGMCSECGASVSETFEARVGEKSSSTATACMVIGILSLVVCQLLGPVAIALYYRADREMAGGGYCVRSTGHGESRTDSRDHFDHLADSIRHVHGAQHARTVHMNGRRIGRNSREHVLLAAA